MLRAATGGYRRLFETPLTAAEKSQLLPGFQRGVRSTVHRWTAVDCGGLWWTVDAGWTVDRVDRWTGWTGWTRWVDQTRENKQRHTFTRNMEDLWSKGEPWIIEKKDE